MLSSIRISGTLTYAKHTLVIRVSGSKNASASDSKVGVDAFVVGTTTTQEKRYGARYGQWKGVEHQCERGEFRMSRAAGTW